MSAAQSDVTPLLASDHGICPSRVPPFGHFHGFSAPTSAHLNMSPTHDYHIPDELISPRMPIPNFHLIRGSPKPRVEELSDDTDIAALPHFQTSKHRVSGKTPPSGLQGAPVRPWPWQLTGHPPHVSPPPVYSSSPEHTYVPTFAEEGPHINLPLRGIPLFPALPHPPATRTRTYHVPSGSEVASEASIHCGPFKTADAHPVDGIRDAAIAFPSDDEDDSTIYPHDSASTSSSVRLPGLFNSHGCFSSVTRYLEEGVVEVHDVCLGATQRYLGALRVNWELRHGRGVAGPVGAGPIRRRRVPAGERGSPYLRATRRHRAASEDGGRRGLHGHGFDDDVHDDVVDAADGCQSRRVRVNRIPRATNSLLQNTSYICDLIWRRALRDREDVLAAETCGCRNMGFLFDCAETIILYDAREWAKDPKGSFEMVCQAGRDLCRELKDLDGIERVNDIESLRL